MTVILTRRLIYLIASSGSAKKAKRRGKPKREREKVERGNDMQACEQEEYDESKNKPQVSKVGWTVLLEKNKIVFCYLYFQDQVK